MRKPPTHDDIPFRRLKNDYSAWMDDEFITEVRVLEVVAGETHAGKTTENMIDEDTGDEETWMCLKAHKEDDPYRH